MERNAHKPSLPTVLCGGQPVGALRILVCDDDAVFLEGLCSRIREILCRQDIRAEICSLADAEALEPEQMAGYQLFFLDISFSNGGCSGMDIARRIRKYNQGGLIFFVTNYPQFAAEGYEVEAFRYLMKTDISEKLERYLQQALEKIMGQRKLLRIQTGSKAFILPLQQVLYLEAQGHNVKLVAEGGKEYVFYSTLTHMEQQLKSLDFLRVQKSFLVNMARIESYRYDWLTLDDGSVIPVSGKTFAENKKLWLLWKGRQ